jgi:hypothetical protein
MLRRHKEWHKELPENVEKQAKTVGSMENMEIHKIINTKELHQ